MIANLNSNEIEEVLRTQLVGRLGCHADHRTYVVPISYAYDGTYIYAHTYEGLKMNFIRKNPQVCFQVDDISNMANWKSVIAWGSAEELTDIDGRNEAFEKLSARVLPFISSETTHLSPGWPFSSGVQSVGGIFFRILLKEKTGRFEQSHPPSVFAS